MIIHIKSKNPDLYLFENSPLSWRKDWSREHLDSLIVALQDGIPVGRLGIYINPYFKKQGIAFLGAFEVIEDYQVSEELLSTAITYLKKHGIKQIIGPVDGSTWNNYRFREAGEEAPFFLEPNQSEWYPKHWKNFGFSACQKYQSNQMSLPEMPLDFLKSNKKSLTDQGIQLRSYNSEQAERELNLLADFNHNAFQKNFLFSPVPKKQFVEKYKSIAPYFDPDLIFLAEDKDGLAGVVFAIPDYLDEKKEKVILKTLARKPGKSYAGLGRYLVHYILQKAKEKGYNFLIHALMSCDNASLALSEKMGASVYSRYSLFRYA